jgi:hypothetical protein
VLSVQKLCSIENFSFSTLKSYKSKTGEFWVKQKYKCFEEENVIFRESLRQLCVVIKNFSSKFFGVYGSETIENLSSQYCHRLYSRLRKSVHLNLIVSLIRLINIFSKSYHNLTLKENRSLFV